MQTLLHLISLLIPKNLPPQPERRPLPRSRPIRRLSAPFDLL
ncbi:MAG: hypothetical protein ACKO8Z_07600 [Prosthecobacter sp.]